MAQRLNPFSWPETTHLTFQWFVLWKNFHTSSSILEKGSWTWDHKTSGPRTPILKLNNITITKKLQMRFLDFIARDIGVVENHCQGGDFNVIAFHKASCLNPTHCTSVQFQTRFFCWVTLEQIKPINLADFRVGHCLPLFLFVLFLYLFRAFKRVRYFL